MAVATRGRGRPRKTEPTPRQTRERERTSQEATALSAPDGAEDLLAKLGAALMATGQTRAQRNRTLAEVEGVLSKLSARDFPELVENPVVMQFVEAMSERKAEQQSDDPPGTIYNSGTLAATKKRWQWRDLETMERVVFTPNETIPVTFNGLMLVLQADMEMVVPKVFKDIYDERRIGLESARQHASVLFRQRDSINSRQDGRRPADPSIISPATGRVRGHGMGSDGYRPGAGLFPYGSEEGEAGGEGGEAT